MRDDGPQCRSVSAALMEEGTPGRLLVSQVCPLAILRGSALPTGHPLRSPVPPPGSSFVLFQKKVPTSHPHLGPEGENSFA